MHILSFPFSSSATNRQFQWFTRILFHTVRTTHQSSRWLSMKVSLYPMNEVPASLVPSAGPSNEPVMPPCSIEPSSPPFEVTDDGDSMNDEIEMEVDFSSKDNTNKKSGYDLVLWKE